MTTAAPAILNLTPQVDALVVHAADANAGEIVSVPNVKSSAFHSRFNWPEANLPMKRDA